VLDPKEYERLQKHYRTLNDETLLGMLKNRSQDYLPEALQLIRDELKLRGYHNEDFAIPGSKPDDESARLRGEDLTLVAKCPDGFVAQQAMDLLSQNGIPSEVYGEDTLPEFIVGQEHWPYSGTSIAVASHDAARAKEILAGFPPLMEENASGPDEQEK
jgi:hypothetical protein